MIKPTCDVESWTKSKPLAHLEWGDHILFTENQEPWPNMRYSNESLLKDAL